MVGPGVTGCVDRGQSLWVPGKGQAPRGWEEHTRVGLSAGILESRCATPGTSCRDPHTPLTQTVLRARKQGCVEISPSSEAMCDMEPELAPRPPAPHSGMAHGWPCPWISLLGPSSSCVMREVGGPRAGGHPSLSIRPHPLYSPQNTSKVPNTPLEPTGFGVTQVWWAGQPQGRWVLLTKTCEDPQ